MVFESLAVLPSGAGGAGGLLSLSAISSAATPSSRKRIAVASRGAVATRKRQVSPPLAAQMQFNARQFAPGQVAEARGEEAGV